MSTWAKRHAASVFSYPKRVYMMCGSDDNGPKNDIWMYS